MEVDLLAVDLDGSLVLALHAIQDLHQGGFAGAILTTQSVHRAAPDREGDVLVRHHTGEAFCDALDLDRERVGTGLGAGNCGDDGPPRPFVRP
jgi:hypothetical protein